MSVFQNTSAVASIDGDEVNTLHASDMADVLASYTRSVALVVDIADLHVLRRALRGENLSDDTESVNRMLGAIPSAFEEGLR